MTEDQKSPNVIRKIFDLLEKEQVNADGIQPGELDKDLVRLRAWQANRLATTYADLLKDKHYAAACRFFLNDIYAGRDFSQRDHEAEMLYKILSRLFPHSTLSLIRKTLRLNKMTEALDKRLLQVLVDELEMRDELEEAMYVKAYRLCDNYGGRLEQIELFVEVLSKVGQGAHNPVVPGALRLTRRPAARAGFTELHSFLERGYQAFKPVRDVEHLINIIQDREKRILGRIYLGTPDPLNV